MHWSSQKKIQIYCALLGIIYQSTYPHTSQQNDVVKRKHRQICNIAHIILFEMRVPYYLSNNYMFD